MYLNVYNNNLYLNLIRQLEFGLSNVEDYVESKISSESIDQLEGIIDVYSNVFSGVVMRRHFEFAISRTHKELYFREVEYNRSNSYYHLKLLVYSKELLWLDELYGGVIYRILKYYKALFSKIDNIFSNSNIKQKAVCQTLISDAKYEIEKFNNISNEKKDINSEKKRLKDQHLSKIPFQGLFHITHKSNIPGILEKGILSHTKAHNSNLFKTDISNLSINEKRSRLENIYNHPIHDYAPLYINPRNPMLESLCKKKNLREDLVLIKVSPNILVNNEILFTDGNAAETSSSFYNNLDDFNKLNWEIISDNYYLNHNDGKRIKCSEVLVHDHIDIPYIDELLTFKEENFECIYGLFPNHMGIQLKIEKDMFF